MALGPAAHDIGGKLHWLQKPDNSSRKHLDRVQGTISFLGVPFTAKNIIPCPLVLLKGFQYDLSMLREHKEGKIRVERAGESSQ